MSEDPAIEAIQRAVANTPDDGALRLHLAQLLLAAGRAGEAVAELGVLLQHNPNHPGARELMLTALSPQGGAGAAPGTEPGGPENASDSQTTASRPRTDTQSTAQAENPTRGQGSAEPPAAAGTAPPGFDWAAAEAQIGDIARPMFVAGEGATAETAGTEPSEAFETERPTITLADVGGMEAVKERLTAAFLAPMRNPELRKLYGKSLRGGLLLYGPPGCGKTFLAKALAGELGAAFITAGLAEILDMWIGSSERNLHELFGQARRAAPCVLFLDEVDALGQKRTQTRNSAVRGVVNQLLTELDGIATQNEGVYVLAATNQPWDVDPALRRPGRLDRTVLVLPPDAKARESIFRYHLAQRPVEGIDLKALAARSEGLSGADVAYACELATERALMDGVRTGTPRMIGMPDLLAGLGQVQPSTGAWLDTVKTLVQYGEDDGTFGELKAYLKKAKRW